VFSSERIGPDTTGGGAIGGETGPRIGPFRPPPPGVIGGLPAVADGGVGLEGGAGGMYGGRCARSTGGGAGGGETGPRICRAWFDATGEPDIIDDPSRPLEGRVDVPCAVGAGGAGGRSAFADGWIAPIDTDGATKP
jgi:hypothetical protein